jgi:hypothetical protein
MNLFSGSLHNKLLMEKKIIGQHFFDLTHVSPTEICIFKFIPITSYKHAFSHANGLQSHYYSSDKKEIVK